MSYEVLARKYRPQTFEDVVGQDHVTRTLANAITQRRLAHAYLFVGPRGIGKTSTARILAKALNCAKGPTVTPCGECVSCQEIAGGNSLDVLEIDGASNNHVEDVHKLRENVRFAPARGRFKVYIIDEVHMLTQQAFNALLKTLEEPPPHAKFVFATTEAHKVLPTILSRCQRFDLRRIPRPLISAHLQKIAALERIELPAAAADAIASAADGGLRDAESMLDQLASFCGNQISLDDVLSVFGLSGQETVIALADSILGQDVGGALALLARQDEAGRDLMRLLADLIGHLRNVLIARVDPKPAPRGAEGVIEEVWKRQAAMTSAERLLQLIDMFSATEERMRWAPNKRLHIEVAAIRCIQSLGETTLSEVLDTFAAGIEQEGAAAPDDAPALPRRPTSPRPPAQSRPSAPAHASAPGPRVASTDPAPPPPAPVVSSPSLPPAAPVSVPAPQAGPAPHPAAGGDRSPSGAGHPPFWQEFIDRVGRSKARLARRLLSAATPLGVEGERIVVGIAPSDSALLPQGRSKASVEKVLNDALRESSGQNLTLHFVVRPELESDQEEDASEQSPTPAGGVPAADAGLAVEPPHGDCYDHDTLIDDALRIFEARIVQDPSPSDSAPRRSARP